MLFLVRLNVLNNVRYKSHENLIKRCYSLLENRECVVKKKNASSKTLPKVFDPDYAESEWYEWWEAQGYFKRTKSNKSFTLLLPPPNVTGTLHLGHALTVTIQDILCRWRRMKGESVFWIPGTDHAGIATQIAVEKQINAKLKLTKHDLGRDEFIKKVWEWKEEKEEKIIKQLRQLGASLDWSRQMFTMDSSHSSAVTAAFIQLYDKGLIYRKNDMINWSCALQSAISDVEIDHVDITKPTLISIPGYEKPVKFGILTDIAYKIGDENSKEEIIVSTTRPETLLGDTAVAVHPDDTRYQHLRNKFAWHPFRKCKIPIIFDNFVDRNFGTGAVKITPAHSSIDFIIGKKHNLEILNIFNESGFISLEGEFKGLKRFDARKIICDRLKDLGLLKGYKDHSTTIPICSRSGDVIEMMIKPQWFLKTEKLGEKLKNAIEDKKLKIQPKYQEEQILSKWIKELRDWNLSRQLWWGHQIPMYKCLSKNDEIWVAAKDLNEAKIKAVEKFKVPIEEIKIEQDSDVLDTWFSSGLLPISRLGWPDCGKEFEECYPLSLMETGYDIVFFWVARMVMLSLELTGKLPFENVLLHGMIRDDQGRKMSKSLGNVILPEYIINGITLDDLIKDTEKSFKEGVISQKEMELSIEGQKKTFPKGIEKCGTGALRFSLCHYDIQSDSINFHISNCYTSKRFTNKIWQAFKYLESAFEKVPEDVSCRLEETDDLNIFNRWILSRMANAIKTVEENLQNYQFAAATEALRLFIYEDLFSTYLEATKPIIWGWNDSMPDIKRTFVILFNCFEISLRLLSPFMPYLTEELYHNLPKIKDFHPEESIMISKFPRAEDWEKYSNEELIRNMNSILEIIKEIRRVKKDYSLRKEVPVLVSCTEEIANELFGSSLLLVQRFAGGVKILRDNGEIDKENYVEREIGDGIVVYAAKEYDKEVLAKQLQPALDRKENILKKIEKAKGKKGKKGVKKLDDLEQDLKKVEELIENIEKALRHCNH